MPDTPPFDPPYFSIDKTDSGVRVIHTGSDGSRQERLLGLHETAGLLVDMPQSSPVSSAATAGGWKKPAKASGGKRPEGATKLAVPFAEKDAAKKLGARWDAEGRTWYVPPGVDATPFRRWLPAADQG
ncbi:hypothetical protein SAMN06265795_12926 [Noviherbaspirillum humi]|uniref:DUF5710 domain-containing protein n=1 Tax=Noviherbaspirillum humi TaxID=1688639 RepID=A0A239M0X1_9BURK|nr:DUF5710 domain-containing protein [Noviherbaspirillum humi]SNT36311.1 hypothetical protein SAMN06265795_12926 [Noviherbaspirillum humi]